MLITNLALKEMRIPDLCKLETIGITDPSHTLSKAEEELAHDNFIKEVDRNTEGRYIVSLPWINSKREIPSNRHMAERRLISSTKKLKSMKIFEEYAKVFCEWEEEGVISKVSNETLKIPGHFLPHHPVIKPDSLTTSVRPVFDASCKVGRSPSLNDCLFKGPNLIEQIPAVLIRFREKAIGVVADIRRAFLQIEVKESDRNFLRFLRWKNSEEFRVYQHNRVVFGATCSPFLLGAVIRYHLSNVDEENKQIAEKLMKAYYVANCVTSVNSVPELENFISKSTEIMADAKMELRMWEFGPVKKEDKSFFSKKEMLNKNVTTTVPVLGLKWDIMEDSLKIAHKFTDEIENLSKRKILAVTQGIFDPIGFLAPAFLPAKLIIQEAWSTKLDWDTPLPEKIRNSFQKCNRAYATAVFLRCEDKDTVFVQLLGAKSRLAPKKSITIPRLELLACVLGVRLTNFVLKAFNSIAVPVKYWTDSSTVLAWIRRNDQWGTFVGNRVREICKFSESQLWNFVPGHLNPADLPSRGCNPKQLLKMRWWEGPEWLKFSEENWPQSEINPNEELVMTEKKKNTVQHVHLEPLHIVRKRSPTQPLRIKVFYDKSVHALPKEKFEVINSAILPQALDYWQKTLYVRPMSVPIKLNRKCPNNQAFFPGDILIQHCKERCENITTCGEVIVPEEHLEACNVCGPSGISCKTSIPAGPGIDDADFVFYVSAMQTDRCHKGQTVAYAAHCQQEAALDRPIAGHANLCPNSISTKPQDLDTLLSTVKHEILHALGFSVSLYAYFRDQYGYPLTPRGRNGKPMVNKVIQAHQWSDNVIREVERRDWKVRGKMLKKTVKMVVTPAVQAEVRAHFNCSYLEGAELEDQGEDGTVLTHWEKRLFENEAMTGTHTQNPVYSRITLALMQDTGWYMPNYSMAQELKWGKNLGCDFAFKSCKDWIDTRRARGESIHPYCDKVKKDPLETECTDSRDSVALCNLVEYTKELPSIFQNFDYIPGVPGSEIGKYGGSVSLADYCPYIQEFTWKSNNIVVRGSQCQFPENMPQPEKNFALEYYGPGSKCFNHNKEMWEERTCQQVRQWQHWGSGCYKYECVSGHLHVIIANHTYTCFHTGQQLKIQIFFQGWLHIGTIVCPPCHEICGENDINCQPDSVKFLYADVDKKYYYDELPCCSVLQYPSSMLILFFTILLWYLAR